MTWLLWRQHRLQAFLTGALLAAFGLAVWLTGVHMAHIYRTASSTCSAQGTCDLVGDLFKGYGAIVDTVHLTIAIPLVLGCFIGATLVARETEHSTNVLVWTQSITRRQWLYTKVAMALAGAAVIGALSSALVTWWSITPNSLYGNRFESTQFDTQSILPVALAVFGMALGIAAGCLIRRTLPALAATVAGYLAVRLAVAVYLRPHYLAAKTVSFVLGGPANVPSGSWTLSTTVVDGRGVSLGNRIILPAGCQIVTHTGLDSCLGRLGYHRIVTFQPPSHYWPFQWIEAGIFAALAAGLTAVAVIKTLRADA